MARMGLAMLMGGVMGCAAFSSGSSVPAPVLPPEGQVVRTLTAADLYQGFEASRVALENGALRLDTRNWPKDGARGIITTDVLDLGGEGVLTPAAAVSALAVKVDAQAPGGTAVQTEVRTGTSYFQSAGTWTEWQSAAGPVEPRGRYAQVRLTLTTGDPKAAPAVSAVTLTYTLTRLAALPGAVTVIEDQVERIVASPVVFGYERQDQPDLVWTRKTFKLDDVIAGKKTEFEQLLALMHWAATRTNKRPGNWSDDVYPWHIRQVLKEENGGTIYGHCMSYCEAMITAAGSFGWQGRHFAIHGVRDTSHEVPEFWVNDLRKWVFFDPSLDAYYTDKKTGEPLNLLEMHNHYLATILKPGEVQVRGRHVNEDRLVALRGRHPVVTHTGGYAYGERKDWDFEFDHGYMTAGWLQLTPRNTWHSQPKPAFKYFGWGPDGFDGFPLYIDAQTPLVEPTMQVWVTRKRDFWWTLNQASLRLVQTGEKDLAVELGQSQPFFQRYLARIDGGEWKPVEAAFTWTLKPGKNRLEVVPEDEFGKRGLASAVTVRWSAR